MRNCWTCAKRPRDLIIPGGCINPQFITCPHHHREPIPTICEFWTGEDEDRKEFPAVTPNPA